VIKRYAAWRGFNDSQSKVASERATALRSRLERGETVYLAGLGVGGHNTGTALIEASQKNGIRLLANNEEERYSGIKHCTLLPEHAVQVLLTQLRQHGLRPTDVHAYLTSWDYTDYIALAFRAILEELPGSLAYFRPSANPAMNAGHFWQGITCGGWLGERLGTRMPLIGMRHHDNHAYFSYGVSPFAGSPDPVMVAVIDGSGDDGAISLYEVRGGQWRMHYSNKSIFDSPGLLYGYLSSTQGGWTIHSSEGRYMGAAAWGDNNRLTNPYYRRLRQLVYFAADGGIFLNRHWANWHVKGQLAPYKQRLSEVIGPPIPRQKMWNPDAILNVEDVEHSPITRDRVDKAAATQLLFEDVLFHVIEHLISKTQSHKLVLTGGAALNCVANMRLLEQFNEQYYDRNLGQRNTRLQLWMPPVPGDAGTPIGAAYHFALRHGAPVGDRLEHAFYCGQAPTSAEIRRGLESTSEIAYFTLGNVSRSSQRDRVADLLAWLVSQNGVVGLFQGVAETGPRALGHRSILANPANPRTRDNLNQLVKFRELVRPLAPMATYEAAHRWFDLSPGAQAGNYNAYNYMVLTAVARPQSYAVIPAVIHADGTGRVQIVREEHDAFCYAYLKAMGRRIGAEVSVNTSLNVGSPIVQSPEQALSCLKRSKGLTALLMIAAEGDVFLAWHNVSTTPKDEGQRLLGLVKAWQAGSCVSTTN
jgi:carbamoyltransferase